MKVGDYVRTKDGNIFQITGSDIEFASEIGSDGNLPFNAKIISSEIIDLIEVGDYVNGHKVIDIAQAPKKAVYIEDSQNKMAHIPYTNNDIKSIVTKEQFESMEYKIEE